MKRLCILGALLLCLILPSAAYAAPPAEFRAITMIDGTVHRGVVVASDADNLRLKTLKGEISLPLLDIAQVQPISREVYLTQEGRRVLFIGTQADRALQDKARKLDAVLLEALKRDLLLVLTPADLSAARRSELAACVDLDCRLKVARAEGLESVYAELESRNGQDRLRLRRLSRSGEQLGDVNLAPVNDPNAEQARLAHSAAVVLGETPPALPPAAVAQTTGASRAGTSTAPPEGANGSSAPRAGTSATPPVAATSSSTTQPSSPSSTTQPSSSSSTTQRSSPASTATRAPTSDKPVASGAQAPAPGASGSASIWRPTSDATVADTPPSAPDTNASADLRRARRLDLLPIPGASSLLYFHDPKNVALSAGVVAVFTGATVYFLGDTRRLGDPNGMPVPWSFEERSPRDGLLLAGVGVVSYVASTWIVNQVVRQVAVKHRRSSGR